MKLIRLLAKIAPKSALLKKVGTKLAVHMLPEEVETKVGDYCFVFRPKIDGLWWFNYSEAEPGVGKILREHLKEGDTFIDIGAYIGYYSILARSIVGESGKVIAFEPNPRSYEMLKRNFEINGFKNCIAENLALSDQEGLARLYIGKHAEDSSSLFPVEEVNAESYVTVKMMTLDKYCELNGIYPDFIKMDAEGAEYKILKGMQKVIRVYHPKLLIEIHAHHLEKQGITLRKFFNSLRQQDYDVLIIKDDRAETISTEELVKLCKTKRKNKFGTLVNQVVFCM